MKVIKRDGKSVEYDANKIRVAIQKANVCVNEEEQITDRQIDNIIRYIEKLNKKRILVEDIQDIIEEKLMSLGKYNLAKEYITYRYTRALVRKSNTTDEMILSVLKKSTKDFSENAFHKKIILACNQREYIAGEVSRDLTKRILLPEKIRRAHDEGVLYFHGSDFFVQSIFSDSFVDIESMLTEGTSFYHSFPQTFSEACQLMSEIIFQISFNQYGAQTIDFSFLGKYLVKSKKYFQDNFTNLFVNESDLESVIERQLDQEMQRGFQTILWQMSTLKSVKLQDVPINFFFYLKKEDPYIEENALIMEVFLKFILGQVLKFNQTIPFQLIYVLDDNNQFEESKYNYLTDLIFSCARYQSFVSFINGNQMRKNYLGNVYAPLGNGLFLPLWQNESGKYQFQGRFNQGTVSLNLSQIALLSQKEEDMFWKLLEERVELCKEALLCRHEALLGTMSDISPLHWQEGAIARLNSGEKIDRFLTNAFSSLTLGYAGLFEATLFMTGESCFTGVGEKFALQLIRYLQKKVDEWRKETNLGFVLYGIPFENICKYFLQIDKEKYGNIKNITDGSSYQIFKNNVQEKEEILSQLRFVAKIQEHSLGGVACIINYDALVDLDIFDFLCNYIQYFKIEEGVN